MVKGIRFRRGTTAEHASFTGQPGEITVDVDKKVVIVHDGSAVGGYEVVGAGTTQRITNKDTNATRLNVTGFSTQGATSSTLLNVAGVTTISGGLYVSQGGDLSRLRVSGVTTVSGGINASEGIDSERLKVAGISTLGNTTITNLSLAGVTTGLNVPGISTLGNTTLSNLSLSGVTTGLNAPGISTLGNTTLRNISLSGVTTGLNAPGISTLTNLTTNQLSVTGVSTITVNSSSDAFRITQTGTGNALLVEDEANPDASPFIVNNVGFVGIGTTPKAKLHVVGDATITGVLTASRIFSDSYGEFTGGTVIANSIVGSSLSISGISTISNLVTIGAGNTTMVVQGNVRIIGITTSAKFISSASNSVATGEGQIFLNGLVGNRIDFNGNGYVSPAFNTRSIGTKIVLYPQVSSTEVDYAIGVEAGTIWNSVPTNTLAHQYKWYGGITPVAVLKGSGELLLGAGVTVSTGISSQRLQVSGGGFLLHNTGIGVTNPTTKLQVAGDVRVSGVVTASKFVGDGSGLTGIVGAGGSGSGIVVKDSGSLVGTAGTIDFGDNLVVSPISAGIVTVSFTIPPISGIGSQWVSTSSGIHTFTNVGVLTDNPTSALTVFGDGRITGILTVGSSSITLDGSSNTISIGTVRLADSSGNANYTGIVTATSFSGNATSATYASLAGVSTYTSVAGIATYAEVSGISTYSSNAGVATYATSSGIATYADTSGIATNATYAISAGIASYSDVSGIATNASYSTSAGIATYATNSGISTYATSSGIATYADVAGIATNAQGLTGSPNIIVGVITATTFVGDGSGLTGIVASGSGVVIKDDGALVGTAGTIDFGSNLSVSPISAGVVTITASGGGGTSSQWVTTSVGIHTLSNVGIGTTNPTSKLTVQGNVSVSGVSTFAGITTITGTTLFAKQLNVSGVSTFAQPITVTGNQYSLFGNGIVVQGTATSDLDGNDFAVQLQNGLQITNGVSVGAYITKSGKFVGTAVTVTGTTFTNQLSVSGVSTFVGFSSFQNNIRVSGISTFNGDVKVGSAITMSATAGIISATTFYGNLVGSIESATNLTGGYASASHLTVSGVATISQGRIQADGSSNLRFGNIAAGSGSVRNIAIGDQVLVSLSGGQGRNIGIGELSYYDTTSGQYNIGIGIQAGQKITTGSYNVIIGGYDGQTGLDIRTSSNNVVIADGQGNIRQYIDSSGNVGIKTTVIKEALTVAGIVSATSFYGTLNAGQLTGSLPAIDGSALIGVVAVGTGVQVRDDGSPVGTAGTIDFGSNLSVSFASGIATVSGASSVSAATTAYALAGTPNLNVGNVVAGIITATSGSRTVTTNSGSWNASLDIANNTADQYRGSILRLKNGSGDYGTGFLNANFDTSGLFQYFSIEQIDSGDNYVKTLASYNYQYESWEFRAGASNAVQFSANQNGVGIGTTNVTSKLTVSGDGKFTGVVTATTFSGSGANLTSLPAGQLTGTLPAIDGSALLNVNATGSGIVVLDDNVNVGSAKTVNFGTGLDVTYSASGIATVTASGGSLQSRTTVTGVTTSIANNGIGNTNITGFKSYALMKVGLSTAGWLRLYTDSTSRTNDVSRSVGEDPAPGSGVIAEVVTTGVSTTQIISPFVMGGNLDDSVSTTIYAAITNLSGSTQAITANLTILQLEA